MYQQPSGTDGAVTKYFSFAPWTSQAIREAIQARAATQAPASKPDSGDIAPGAVDTTEIADNAVTITKIADTLQSTDYSQA